MGPKCQKLARKSLLMQKASIFLLPSTFHNINIWSQRFFIFFYFCWLCSKSTRKFMKATLIRVGHYTFQGIRAAQQQQQFSQQSHQPYFWSQLQFQAFSILNEKRDTHTVWGNFPAKIWINPVWGINDTATVIESYSKCRNWIFELWHFPSILTCLVTLFDRKLHIFKNSLK